jgi:two-component system, response regulator PdtaR
MSNDPGSALVTETRASRPGLSGPGGPKLLIADDDYLVTIALAGGLRDAGFDVVGIASSAQEAIALAETRRPTLILMDIRLAGERDGIDAALEIFRALGIRCLFVTAHQDERTRARAECASPLGWLAKPYATETAVAMAKRAIRRLEETALP